MSEALSVAEFPAFFEAVHGHAPFPWQVRLTEQLVRQGHWPDLLDLPTGTGKTAALDCAVFHLALEAGRPDRKAPLRVLFVVDRRTIVDQAHRRAESLRKAITGAQSGILARVKERLCSFSKDGEALAVAILRGGIPRGDDWARTPDQPLLVISTVDQVGSRLLFRGYGVSDAMKSIHAGLLGNDTLWLLDEVHLSEPFRETLAAVADTWRGWAAAPLPSRFQVVEMSATPGHEQPERQIFGLAADDRVHRVLERRLEARKPVSLKAELRTAAFVGECARTAATFAHNPGASVAVVVNRVRTARDVAAELTRTIHDNADVVLVTGRMRPLDRDRVAALIEPRVAAGRERDSAGRPLIVVATQCIEAGADYDFDALVTECASIDALRQRFGRLNRLGDLGHTPGVILGRAGDLADDPVYGNALQATLQWLRAQPSDPPLDFGPGMTLPAPDAMATMLAPRPHAPILLPAHLDAWTQTAPVPEPDPDVSLWLHGPKRGPADVQFIWRADLDGAVLARAHGDEAITEAVVAIVQAVPPANGEAMAVPFVAAKRWLGGLPEPDAGDADVEGMLLDPDDEPRATESSGPRPVLVWRGDDSYVLLEGDGDTRLRPGDTVIAPASYGGISKGTWSPGNGHPVPDLAEAATLVQRGRVVLRMHPEVLRPTFGDAWASSVPRPNDETPDRDAVLAWLERVADAADAPEGLAEAARRLLSERKRFRIARVPALEVTADPGEPRITEREVWTLTSRKRWTTAEGDATTEEEEGSFTGRKVPLADHLRGVAEFAADFAERLSLPRTIVEDLRLAGWWHDVGKADRRFQRLLHGGSAYKTESATEPIAKSATDRNDRRARRRAQLLSGYPRGQRHEVTSVAMMRSCEAELSSRAHDWDLVLHLVASHHGHCRPLAPFVEDPTPVDVTLEHDGLRATSSSATGLERLDSGIGDRFWGLVRKYGWWGLAWLEAIIRLGDHRRSEAEQAAGGDA